MRTFLAVLAALVVMHYWEYTVWIIGAILAVYAGWFVVSIVTVLVGMFFDAVTQKGMSK